MKKRYRCALVKLSDAPLKNAEEGPEEILERVASKGERLFDLTRSEASFGKLEPAFDNMLLNSSKLSTCIYSFSFS